MAEEVTIAYTIEVQGVIGIDPEEWGDRATLENHLEDVNHIRVEIEGVTEYHPDSVALTYLEDGILPEMPDD